MNIFEYQSYLFSFLNKKNRYKNKHKNVSSSCIINRSYNHIEYLLHVSVWNRNDKTNNRLEMNVKCHKKGKRHAKRGVGVHVL